MNSEESSNECDVNADCTNTKGSYNCNCRVRYFEDGEICSGKQSNLIGYKIDPGKSL